VRARLAALALLALTSACVSTDIDDTSNISACVPSRGDVTEPSIVKVRLEDPYVICNAVPIAPTLLLTATECVTLPAAPENGLTGYVAPECTSSGAPREDGSFIFRFTSAASTTSLSLLRDDGSPIGAAVAQIFVSSTASLCMPALAVIETDVPLDLTIAAVRLDDTTHEGEEVTLSGYDLADNGLSSHTTDATIEEVTGDVGTATLPPRSLRLSGQACTLQGGAVLSRGTGALVGIVRTSEINIECANEMGAPSAVLVPPLRQFLLETASAARASLLAEPDHSGSIDPCPEGT
jgi:hypothetical protein